MFRKESTNDPVNHPRHYQSNGAQCAKCTAEIECIDITRHMNFNLGNAIKYIWRYQAKSGLEDLLKARWYLDDFIKQLEMKVKT